MVVPLSEFARSARNETAFDVLAVAKRLKASGKDVVELQIGDSPFSSPAAAKAAAIAAIESNDTHYCASPGLPEFREAAADAMNRAHGLSLRAENIVAGPGAKIFEQLFCEVFLNPGDEVLVFSPHFPTYLPNIHRRQGMPILEPLKQADGFRPPLKAVERFIERPRARAIFLNTPHNPTGGVAQESDVRGLCNLIRGRQIALFSDEPYEHMVWQGKHVSPLSQPEMIDQCVAAYTFSKSYSMSGWRLGFAVTSSRLASVMATMINTSLSCTPPLVQRAGIAALHEGAAERDRQMQKFHRKVEVLTLALSKVPGVHVNPPAATFYAFPNVAKVCNRLGITSHGLAMYLLEAADDRFGVACLGGECFGDAGLGFLRFSCAETEDRLEAAVRFLPDAFQRESKVADYLSRNPHYRLSVRLTEP